MSLPERKLCYQKRHYFYLRQMVLNSCAEVSIPGPQHQLFPLSLVQTSVSISFIKNYHHHLCERTAATAQIYCKQVEGPQFFYGDNINSTECKDHMKDSNSEGGSSNIQ